GERDQALVRHLIRASPDILRVSYDQARPADQLLEMAERRVLAIDEMGVTGQTTTLEQAVNEAYDRLDARHGQDHLAISGLPAGYVDLDEKTAGFQNSELVIVAARPSVGKTAFALNVVRHLVVEDNNTIF